jgi:hypothetical protein
LFGDLEQYNLSNIEVCGYAALYYPDLNIATVRRIVLHREKKGYISGRELHSAKQVISTQDTATIKLESIMRGIKANESRVTSKAIEKLT